MKRPDNLKVGDKFIVTGDASTFDKGDIIELVNDDGTVNPFFSIAGDKGDVCACNFNFLSPYEEPEENTWDNSGGIKKDDHKLRTDLLPYDALMAITEVFTFGAKKYSDRNWEKGMQWTRVFGSLMRHSWAWMRGEDNDPESGLPHLAHAGCCAMMLLAYQLRWCGNDDRVKDMF